MTVFLKQTVNPLLAKLKGIEGQTWLMLGLFVVVMIAMIEPSFADIFADAWTKATTFKVNLIAFGKVACVVSFVAAIVAAISGRVSWHWVGVIVGVALALLAVDAIATFFQLTGVPPAPPPPPARRG